MPAKKVYALASAKANKRSAPFWLGCVFLIEIFLFLPLDVPLVLFCLENPSKRLFYVAVAATASTISGAVGNILGYLAWDSITPYVKGGG